MLQIRQGVFETNSSSVHSLTMCSDQEMNDWINGKLYFNGYKQTFVPATLSLAEMDPEKRKEEGIFGYKEYWDCIANSYFYCHEFFEKSYKTSSGEVVHAFGYYGEDR